jgi:hypothetical protein
MPRIVLLAGIVTTVVVTIAMTLIFGRGEEAPALDKAIVAVKTTDSRNMSKPEILAACRKHAEAKGISADARRKVRRICNDVQDKNREEAGAAALAACLVVARETGDLEACGFNVVSP